MSLWPRLTPPENAALLFQQRRPCRVRAAAVLSASAPPSEAPSSLCTITQLPAWLPGCGRPLSRVPTASGKWRRVGPMRVPLGVEPTSSSAALRGHLLSSALHEGHLLSSPLHSSLPYFSVLQPEDCGLFPCSAVHVLGLRPCWDQAAGKRVKSPWSFRCLRPGWRTGRERRRNGGFPPLSLEPKLGGSPCSPPYLPLEPTSGFRTP